MTYRRWHRRWLTSLSTRIRAWCLVHKKRHASYKNISTCNIAHPQTIYKAIKKGELRATNCDEYGLRGKSYTLEKEELIRWFTNKYVTAVA